MKPEIATVLAFAAAPIVPALGYSVAWYRAGLVSATSALELSFGFYYFSAIVMIVLAVPLAFVLRHFNLARWWTAILGGFSIGLIVAVVEDWRPGGSPLLHGDPATIRAAIMNVALGALAGLVFWLIWKQGEDTV